MQEFWQGALGIAGLGAVVSFVFWSLYRGWLKLPIFQQLTKEQLYKLFRIFLLLTFMLAISYYGLHDNHDRCRTTAEGLRDARLRQSTEELKYISNLRMERLLSFIEYNYSNTYDKKKQYDLKLLQQEMNSLRFKYCDALDNGDFVKFSETVRTINIILISDKVRSFFEHEIPILSNERFYVDYSYLKFFRDFPWRSFLHREFNSFILVFSDYNIRSLGRIGPAAKAPSPSWSSS